MEISDGYLNEIECELAALKAENERLKEDKAELLEALKDIRSIVSGFSYSVTRDVAMKCESLLQKHEAK